MKRRLLIFAFVPLLAMLPACSSCVTDITVADPASGVYSTQTPMSSIDYNIYMSKQITAFMNQLTTHILMLSYSDTGMYEEELSLAREALTIMQDIHDEIVVTMPAKTAEDDREGLLLAMEVAIGHMEDYVDALETGANVSRYSQDFKNDNTAISMYANLYYQ